jgi:hypothetical protein
VEWDNSARGARRLHLAEDHWIPSRDRHQLGSDPALLHHGGDRLGVALDIRAVGGNVGDCEQRDKLVHNDAFVSLAPLPGGQRSGIRRSESLGGKSRREHDQQ